MQNITLDEIRTHVAEAMEFVAPIIKFVGDNPEVGYKEEKACAKQVEYLTEQGFTVKKGVADISTAFKGEYSAAGDNGVKVALLTEYDALQPPMDHACGHQLIMGVGLLALTAVRKLVEKYQIPGTVQAIGCPAEEQLGGKVYMIRKDVFADSSIALLSHPFSVTVYPAIFWR
jgi:metal-dependent amidase/aminoacylase/carboxypeptidase family protein